MRGIDITDGDLLAIYKNENTNNRQIIVVQIDDNITVKKLNY
ncbi:S24 family peptidase [Candidatus Gullanella endobia]|nr:S24 family peptidase [Candidatus Gullanella endobia]